LIHLAEWIDFSMGFWFCLDDFESGSSANSDTPAAGVFIDCTTKRGSVFDTFPSALCRQD
jgi:hypothetical protein